MLRTILKRTGSGLLIAAIICTMSIPQNFSYGATIPRDVKGHWAETYIVKAINDGILNGYPNGGFKPDNPVSRAEFIHMINAVLGNNGSTSINFNDTVRSEWYYNDVSKAVAAGYVNGYADNSFKPNNTITREEATVMLARIVPIYGKTGNLGKFADGTKVSDWAVESFQRIYGKGYIGAYDDAKLHPQDKMTRAQAAKIICDISTKETIVKSDPQVDAAGSSLSDRIYSNGLTISRALGEGNVYLSNCVILGTLNIQGGGENSVEISNTQARLASVAKPSGRVRVYLKGESNIDALTVSNEATLQTSSLTGGNLGKGFKKIQLVRDSNVVFTGNFPSVEITGPDAEATFTAGTVEELTIGDNAADTDITVETSASVASVKVNSRAKFHGNGTIRSMDINADDVSYSKKPDRVTIGKNVTTQPDTSESIDGDITISPANKATRVDRNTEIKLTFRYAMTLYNGRDITSSNIDDFVELRKETENGSRVNFDGTISSSGKIITIEPTSRLDDDTRYYIHIDRNELEDSKGNGNDSFTSYFSTGDDETSSTIGDVTISPAHRQTDVAVNTAITLKFKYAMTLYNGRAITSSNIDDFLELRKGSYNGSNVSFSAKIDSNDKIITITPDRDLSDDTKYYVSIDRNELKDSGNDGNPSFSTYFTTGDDSSSEYLTFYPKRGETGVSISEEPSIKLSEKMLTYRGNTLTGSNLSDVITFRKDSASGSRVPYDVTLNSARTTINIRPRAKLSENTKYYLAINERSLKTESKGTIVPDASVTWTTVNNSEPRLTALSATPYSDTAVSVSATANQSGTFYGVIIPADQAVPSAEQVYNGRNASGNSALSRITGSLGSNSRNMGTLGSLTAGTSYKVCAIHRIGNTNSSVYATNVTTTSNTTPVVSNIAANATENTVTATFTGTQGGTIYAVLIPNGETVPSSAQVRAGTDRYNSSVGSNRAQHNTIVTNGSRTLTFTGLPASTAYRVCAVLESGSSLSPVREATVSTTSPVTPDAKLTGLTIGGKSVSISGTTIQGEVSYVDGLKSVTVVATGAGNDLLRFDGESWVDGTATKDVKISNNSGTTSLTIRGNGKKDVTYTIQIAVKGGNTAATFAVSGTTAGSNDTYTLLSSTNTAVEVTVTLADSKSTVTINESNVIVNGTTANATVSLDSTQKTTSIPITVRNNGSSQEYTLTIIRPDKQPDKPPVTP